MQNHFTLCMRRANPAVAFAALALAIAGAIAPAALAQDISQSAVDNVHNFLKTRDRGSDILGFLLHSRLSGARVPMVDNGDAKALLLWQTKFQRFR